MSSSRFRGAAVAVGALLLLTSGLFLSAAPQRVRPTARDRQDAIPPALRQVTAWRLSFTLSASGSGKAVDGAGHASEFSYFVSAHGTALLDYRKDGSWSWSGQPDVTVSAKYTGKDTYKDGSTYKDEFAYDGPPRVNTRASAHLSFLNQQGYGVMLGDEEIRVSVKTTAVSSTSPTRVTTALKNVNWSPIWTQRVPYPPSSTVLTGVLTAKYHAPILHGSINDSSYNLVFVADYRFEPVLDELLLEVTSPDYETWRPSAEPGPRPGQPIQFTATVEQASGQPPQVTVDRFVWELISTSREPGIAMNLPLAAADQDPDLKFDPQPGQTATGADNQKLERQPVDGLRDTAVVAPSDWGGWSTLRVTAYLRGGATVVGKYKGSQEQDVRLPKRAKDSYIADAWKKDTGASGADLDDDEKAPVGAPGGDGDGLALYEEYRGFYENGEHIEGDPKTIDFFVRNYIGADAEPGIFLFAELTGAEVYSRLLDTEFDRQKRVMNANHRQGPHLVDQHGVFLETQAGLDGGLTVLSKAGVRGRPVITLSVNLQPRDSLTLMGTSENVPFSDLAFAYDRAVAHELMHSVGADHHGEGDGNQLFYFVYGDDPQNATGKPHFRWPRMAGGGTVTIIDEASGRDLASVIEGDMMLLRESLRPNFYPDLLVAARRYLADHRGDNIPWTAEQLAEHELDSMINALSWFIGAEHGQSSGDELCVMRYYFARLYPKKNVPDTFYVVRDIRTERAGLELCRSPEGTGINDKDRKPQPRYGDAAATRGACAASIIFNDALPLKSDAIPKEPAP